MPLTIVVADRGGARFLSTPDLRVIPHLVDELKNPDAHRRESELGTDAPGRVMSRTGVRHSLSARGTLQDNVDRRFAREVGARLGHGPHVNVGDVIIVAPPRFMKLVVEHLGAAVRTRVRAQVPKDLVHATIEELRDYLVTGPGAASIREGSGRG
jgi:protein required for attachment to host cells